MTLKLRLLISLMVLFVKTALAQDLETVNHTTEPSQTSFLDRTEFKASYVGTIFWNNGLNLGAEYLLKEHKKVKNRKRGQRTNTHEFRRQGRKLTKKKVDVQPLRLKLGSV